jgi:hypothetical protein
MTSIAQNGAPPPNVIKINKPRPVLTGIKKVTPDQDVIKQTVNDFAAQDSPIHSELLKVFYRLTRQRFSEYEFPEPLIVAEPMHPYQHACYVPLNGSHLKHELRFNKQFLELYFDDHLAGLKVDGQRTVIEWVMTVVLIDFVLQGLEKYQFPTNQLAHGREFLKLARKLGLNFDPASTATGTGGSLASGKKVKPRTTLCPYATRMPQPPTGPRLNKQTQATASVVALPAPVISQGSLQSLTGPLPVAAMATPLTAHIETLPAQPAQVEVVEPEILPVVDLDPAKKEGLTRLAIVLACHAAALSNTRPPSGGRNRSVVDHIMKYVEPPADPDPYLKTVPAELGGQRDTPLSLHFERPDRFFTLSPDTLKILELISASLQVAWRDKERAVKTTKTEFRSFALAGPPGTGKNTIGRQVAAALGLPYVEVTFTRETSLQEEIGQTVLVPDSQTGTTTTRARLGKLGQAAAAGSVICLNELVKAEPGILGALQTMVEDGFFNVGGTEAGLSGGRVPVHSSTIFIGTFNPTYDGAADRPEGALLSRLLTLVMDPLDLNDQVQRLENEWRRLFNKPPLDGSEDFLFQQSYSRDFRILSPDPKNLKNRLQDAARFINELQRLAGADGQPRSIGINSPHIAAPTSREALRFVTLAEVTGKLELALEQFKIYCDQGEDFKKQWERVITIFKRYYGDDGRAGLRRDAGKGPRVY